MEEFMSSKEKEVFRRYLSNCSNYFEFGSGGSTYRASITPNIKTITTVESDKVFSEKIKKSLPKIDMIYIDIGPTREFGNPSNRSKIHLWKNYPNAVKNCKENTDLVLVDGRFRVACALTVCLELPDSTVIVHDFNNRLQYHCILPYFDFIESIDTIVVLKPKAKFDREKCLTLLNKHYEIFN
jgi:hypothetical protein